MEEITFQDIYDGFARVMERNRPITNPGQLAVDAALYRSTLPQFRQEIIRKLHEVGQSTPNEIIENMEIAVHLYRRFEATFAPA